MCTGGGTGDDWFFWVVRVVGFWFERFGPLGSWLLQVASWWGLCAGCVAAMPLLVFSRGAGFYKKCISKV